MDSPSVITGQVLYGLIKRGFSTSVVNPGVIWTPATGKAIRLASYVLEMTGQGTLGVAGQVLATISTPTLTISVHAFRMATTMLGNGLWAKFERGFAGGVLLPRGEALSLTMSPTLGTGTAMVHAFGREE